MSWCGGGEIRPTPGVERRTRAMFSSTLWPGNWPPSPGLAPCAILICRSSALTRYSAETARRHLLDGRAHGIAVGQRLEAIGLLTALASVRLAADAVHGDGERGVRLAADRAVGHGARRETLDDIDRRLDFIERHSGAAVLFRGLDAEQRADGQVLVL